MAPSSLQDLIGNVFLPFLDTDTRPTFILESSGPHKLLYENKICKAIQQRYKIDLAKSSAQAILESNKHTSSKPDNHIEFAAGFKNLPLKIRLLYTNNKERDASAWVGIIEHEWNTGIIDWTERGIIPTDEGTKSELTGTTTHTPVAAFDASVPKKYISTSHSTYDTDDTDDRNGEVLETVTLNSFGQNELSIIDWTKCPAPGPDFVATDESQFFKSSHFAFLRSVEW